MVAYQIAILHLKIFLSVHCNFQELMHPMMGTIRPSKQPSGSGSPIIQVLDGIIFLDFQVVIYIVPPIHVGLPQNKTLGR